MRGGEFEMHTQQMRLQSGLCAGRGRQTVSEGRFLDWRGVRAAISVPDEPEA